MLSLGVLGSILACLGCDDRTITIKGVVHRQGTDVPVANARAIVTVYDQGLQSFQIKRYGLTADSNGDFDTVIESPIPVTDVRVEICTPDEEYTVVSNPKKGFSLTAGVVPDPYMKMYNKSKGKPWMEFETFGGAARLDLDEPVTFLGEEKWQAIHSIRR